MKSIVFHELPAHDTNWAITTGRDGKIYVGVCGELTSGLSVFIASYDPRSGQTEYLVEVGPALNEPSDSGRAPVSKIHYCMIPAADGGLYCATHFSGAPQGHFIWRPWHTWDDPDRMAPGFHIFKIDPVTERIEDYGIMSPNEGSRIMALAERRGLLYGVTWPRDHFYVFDLKNSTYKDMGRFGDINPQTIWLDGDENCYTVDDFGYVVKYDATTGSLGTLAARIPWDGAYPSEIRSAYDAVPSPDGKSVFGVTWNIDKFFDASARLFRFDLADGKITDLGPPISAKELSTHVGGMVFGDDCYLYYAASRKDPGRRIPYRMHLFRMDPRTQAREEIAPLDDGNFHAEYISKATKDYAGNLYFADTNNRPTRVYVFTPEGAGKTFATRWPLIRSWG